MNKKVLFKVMACVLFCVCFIVAGKHMPLLMGAVYDAVLSEFNHTALFFVWGLFVLEIIALKRWGQDQRCYHVCLGITIAAAFLVLFQGSTHLGDRLEPGKDTTLLNRMTEDTNISDDGRQISFAQYYLEDKNLILSEEDRQDEALQNIFRMAVLPQNCIYDEKAVLQEDEAQRVLAYPHMEYEPVCFVLDDEWKTSDTVRLASWGDKYVLCSETLFDKVLQSVPVDGAGSQDAIGQFFEMPENSPYREAKQIAVMLMFFAIGCAALLPLLGKDYPYLSFFMGLPVGAALWCVGGIVFMIFHIPYNMFTMLGCLILLIGGWLFRRRDRLKTIEWSLLGQFMLYAVTVTVFLAYYKACYTSADSLTRCIYSYRLASFGSMRDILGSVAPYGILEPMVQSIGYLVGCDMLYVFYPLMAACGLGIMVTGMYYVYGKKDNYVSAVILGTGILLLLTNFDYILSVVLMGAHGPTAVYTLILLMFIVMKKKIDIPGFEGIALLAATMIIVTRIEGAIYVLFFLALSLGIENNFLKMYKLNIGVAAVTIVWNVFQIVVVGSNVNPLFWTPERGILLIISAILLLAVTWLAYRRWLLVDFVRKIYFPLAAAALFLLLAVGVVFLARDMASANLQIYLSHFSNNSNMNDRINAGALWTFVLLLCPMVMKDRDRLAQYAVTSIGGYIILIYFICLFRRGALLHYGFFDSGRRTLVQIMPAAIWLLAYCAGSREKTDKIRE